MNDLSVDFATNMFAAAASAVSTTTAIRGQLLAVMVAALGAVVVYFFALRRKRLDEKKQTCAKALAQALAWLELPYRIRRRMSNEPEVLRGIVDRTHQLQEDLLFYQAWMRIELPAANEAYRALVAAAKGAVLEPARLAWRTEPVSAAEGMNIGDLKIGSIETEVDEFARVVRKDLSWWRFWSDT